MNRKVYWVLGVIVFLVVLYFVFLPITIMVTRPVQEQGFFSECSNYYTKPDENSRIHNGKCTCIGIPISIDEGAFDGPKIRYCFGYSVSSCTITKDKSLRDGGAIVSEKCAY